MKFVDGAKPKAHIRLSLGRGYDESDAFFVTRHVYEDEDLRSAIQEVSDDMLGMLVDKGFETLRQTSPLTLES